MRQARDAVLGMLALGAVWAVFVVATPRDVEANLGIPACADRSHAAPCRVCARSVASALPKVIDGRNLRMVIPAAQAVADAE